MKFFINQPIILTCLLTVFCFLFPLLKSQNNSCFSVQTRIENGVIEGLYDTQTKLQMYLGIPYAKPPVGELRWKAPQNTGNWDGIKETKKFGPRAVQSNVFGDMNFRSNGISEDCLYLNVWTPAKRNTSGLSVLVYFYGGGFVAGDGSEPRYDGASMAKKGIVVVTVNYRLGIFGFLAHPELSAESSGKTSGNYGLLDQNAALKWVNRNIKAFGGDPEKVTIAGESAGSISVSAQMVSPLSKGLFTGAIGESGAAIFPTIPPVPLADAEKQGLDFLQNAGIKNIKQLRAMSTREIYEIYNESNQFRFPLVIDGYFFPKSPVDIFKAQQQSQVPLLVGWNSAEIPGTAFMRGLPYTDTNYVKRVKETYGANFDQVLKLYPTGSVSEIEQSATALASDRFISYSTWKWFDLHRKYNTKPVYRYLFCKVRPPFTDKSLTAGLAGGTIKKNDKTPTTTAPVGAAHSSEIEYCMGNLDLNKDHMWTSDDYRVSEIMQNYFANFIKTGNPNGTDLPQWPGAEAQDPAPPVMNIDVDSKTIKADNDARYLFLDESYKNN